jgi:prepilin-type N-terminal cleavage/methylation domain-containing protein
MASATHHHRPSGVTLVELVVAMGIMAIIALLATQTFVAFTRENTSRRKVADVQGSARFALDVLERELRHASLGAGTGRIWPTSGANRASRPAVQIFTDVAGTGTLALGSISPQFAGVKPGTDALLVVEGFGSARAATIGELTSATLGMPRTFNVSTLTTRAGGVDHTLAVGDAVLVGDYLDATWAVLGVVNGTANPKYVTTTADLVLPGTQIPRLPAGSVIRRARARLSYVDVRDQLVRLDLRVPRAPATLAEIAGGEVLATGIENVQLDCGMAGPNGAVGACTVALGAGHAISTESVALFGAFPANTGPIIDDASNLRTIVFNVAARSVRPLADVNGDPAIELDDVTLTASGVADPTAPFVRRAYQFSAGVRNTSLGAL